MPSDPLSWAGYDEARSAAAQRAGTAESVVCGRGTVGGAEAVLIAFDFRFLGGSVGTGTGARIVSAFARARAAGLPVVSLIATGGTRMQEGMLSLRQLQLIAGEAARTPTPHVAVLRDPATGGVWASLGAGADVVLAEPGAQVAFAGRRVRPPSDADDPAFTAEAQLAAGHVDELVDSLPEQLADWLSLLTDGSAALPVAPTDSMAGSPSAAGSSAAVGSVPAAAASAPKIGHAVPSGSPVAAGSVPEVGHPAPSGSPAAAGSASEAGHAVPSGSSVAAGSVAAGSPPAAGSSAAVGSVPSAPASAPEIGHVVPSGSPVAAGSSSAAGSLAATGAVPSAAASAPAGHPAPAGSPAAAPVPRALGELTPAASGWDAVRRTRSAARPRAVAYLDDYFTARRAIRGDRAGGVDEGMLCGIGRHNGRSVAYAAQAGTATTPAGFRTASRLVRLADRLGLPVLTLVDTPGAAADPAAERAGAGPAIAELFATIASARVPVTTLVIGEGGSGGALALCSPDRLWIAPDAYFSVIAPELAAAILKRDQAEVPALAGQLKLRPAELLELGVVRGIASR